MRKLKLKWSLTVLLLEIHHYQNSNRSQMLKPNDKAQTEMVINGLADILLRAAEGGEAVFCLPGKIHCLINNNKKNIFAFY
jgi:hypothetical protein